MNRRRCKFLWFAGAQLCCAAVAAVIGCGEAYVAPVVLDTTGVRPAADYGDLAAVLQSAFVTKRSVRQHRFIDPDAAVELASRLDTQLKRLAVTGPGATPQLFPTAEARLAYWYNARAAWALKLAMLKEFPRKLARGEFYTRRFPLDGRQATLQEIDAILAADSDWRTLAAAPCVTLQRARLPAEPFGEKDIREQIARRLGDFIDDDERFVISVARKEIRVPPVIWRFEQILRESHEAACGTCDSTLTTALLPYVAGPPHRRLQDAIGYRCVPAPAAYEVALEKE